MSERTPPIAAVQQILGESLHLGPVGADVDLVESGLIDSAAFMDLFVLLEDRFGIKIEAGDMDLEHFRTAARMAAFVAGKQAGPPGR
ncbi:acyl carrier protein [Sorangium sp. So ce363]|jgi:acyl carrier protein|uniref:acyl carrier protein n=1 Tax=unclassified Sorangium TaxID=2621164 RepID=UPI003F6228EE